MDLSLFTHVLLPGLAVLLMGADKIVHTYITAKKGVDHTVLFDTFVKAVAKASTFANPEAPAAPDAGGTP